MLRKKGYKIDEAIIKKGLGQVVHRARFEMISRYPKVIFDGGHNEDAIQNLKKTIDMYYPNERKVYILSTLKTKDYKTIIKLLTNDKNGIFYFTTGIDSNRYVDGKVLYKEAQKYLKENFYYSDLENAIKTAKEKYKENVILIIGSFYVYSDVLKMK